MKTAAAYIRVSTEDQIEFSPDSQKKKILEYAEAHGLTVPEEYIYVDEGISGRTAERRPSFMEMIKTAKTKPKPFEVILLWKFSRFARNRQDAIFYKSMLRKECGVEVVSITEQLSDDPTSILVEALLEAMDEYYSINLGQEVKRGMNERFARGGIVTIAPFGYDVVNGEYVVNKEEAPIIQMIFDDFVNGMPYVGIARKINEMGIRTKRGNKFENRTVMYILLNPVYIGKLRWTPTEPNLNDRYHENPDTIIIDGGHEPLVTVEQFTAANRRVAEIRARKSRERVVHNTDYMLKGLVKCSSCGANLTIVKSSERLQCQRYSRGVCTTSHSVSINRLNEAVLKRIQFDLAGGELNIITRRSKPSMKSESIDSLIASEKKKLQRVKDAYEAGIDSLDEYRYNKLAIQDRIKKLEDSINRGQNTDSAQSRSLRCNVKKIMPKLLSDKISELAKNEMLKSFISEIVFDRKACTILIKYYVNE